MMKMLSVTYHEAGHIVVCEYSRYFAPCGTYDILSSEHSGEMFANLNGYKLKHSSLPADESSERLPIVAKELAVVALAGYQAELEFSQRQKSNEPSKHPSKSDFMFAQNKLRGAGVSGCCLWKYHKMARNAVRQHWSDISKLADFMINNPRYSAMQALDAVDVCNDLF